MESDVCSIWCRCCRGRQYNQDSAEERPLGWLEQRVTCCRKCSESRDVGGQIDIQVLDDFGDDIE